MGGLSPYARDSGGSEMGSSDGPQVLTVKASHVLPEFKLVFLCHCPAYRQVSTDLSFALMSTT